MSGASFTPGTWHVANGTQIRSEQHQIAKVWMFGNGAGSANANLIAAAPDLLKALERAEHALGKLSTIDCGCVPCTGSCRTGRGAEIELEGRMDYADVEVRKVRAALAKARGEA
jgi:hypothetical protein